jgi:hypothetical protein
MTRDNIIRMAREADIDWHKHWNDDESNRLEVFAVLVAAADREHMISDGWRQCAQGQRTSQHCAVAEQARREEREAVCHIVTGLCISDNNAEEINRAIRARGQA